MKMTSVKEKEEPSESAKTATFTDIAIFSAVCWIVVALFISLVFRVNWFIPGDFSYTVAMYYHGIMVPVLILLYLLINNMFHLKMVSGRIFAAGAILAILYVGPGSIFNTSEGISFAAVAQILGMVLTDLLGVILLIAMAVPTLGKNRRSGKTGVAFRLLFFSIVAILIAAPLGHIAGWGLDMGVNSIPGSGSLLDATGLKPGVFLDGLIASHSHLIAAALLCGLAAVAAMFFQYQSRAGWRRKFSTVGLWTALISILSATAIYAISAMTGWEPPAFFVSGPNGIPLDDLVLTAGETGILLLLVGLSGPLRQTDTFPPLIKNIRLAVFLNWIFGFAGAVLPGIYIELNERFFGAGASPAPGALYDNIFIRAHLLFPFFLLPIVLAVLLAVGYRYEHTTASFSWPRLFVWTSVFGMTAGLAGELLWFATGTDSLFIAGMFAMSISLIAGMISLWPAGIVKTAR